jgi:hypothetical protein
MGQILTTAAQLSCPHGGSVIATSLNSRTGAAGAYMLRPSDTFTVAGCPFTLPNGQYHPCTTVEWRLESRTTSAAGDAVLTTDSLGLCKASDMAVQGTVLVQVTQSRVSAS